MNSSPCREVQLIVLLLVLLVPPLVPLLVVLLVVLAPLLVVLGPLVVLQSQAPANVNNTFIIEFCSRQNILVQNNICLPHDQRINYSLPTVKHIRKKQQFGTRDAGAICPSTAESVAAYFLPFKTHCFPTGF